jgi:hypothetical protein
MPAKHSSPAQSPDTPPYTRVVPEGSVLDIPTLMKRKVGLTHYTVGAQIDNLASQRLRNLQSLPLQRVVDRSNLALEGFMENLDSVQVIVMRRKQRQERAVPTPCRTRRKYLRQEPAHGERLVSLGAEAGENISKVITS